MPLISTQHKRLNSGRVKSHVLPRPVKESAERSKRWAWDLESYSPPKGHSDALDANVSPKIGRFDLLDEPRTPTSSDSSDYGYSPPSLHNTPLTLRVAQGSRAGRGPNRTVISRPNAGETAVASILATVSGGSIATVVEPRFEIRRHNGSSYAAPVYFGQTDGKSVAINVAIKRFPLGDAHDSSYGRSGLSPATASGYVKRQYDIAKAQDLNLFKPNSLTFDSSANYITYPLAKATLKDVIYGMYGAASPCTQMTVDEWRGVRDALSWRVMMDLLPQLSALHTGANLPNGEKFSHNNIRASNVLMDASGHFHLGGWGSATVAGVPLWGDWHNKRPEAVFRYSGHDSRKDDLWALGKLFVRLYTMPQGTDEQQLADKWNSPDPFRPDYLLPDSNVTAELVTLPTNVHEARGLHQVWSDLYGDYKGWFERLNTARKNDVKNKEEWPKRRKYETAARNQHAKRIHDIFYALSRKDSEANGLRLALHLFDPKIKDTYSADKLARVFEPLFKGKFLSEKKRELLDGALKRATQQDDSVAASSMPGQLTENEIKMYLKALKNENMLTRQLGRIEGEGMRLCNQNSSSHTIRSPSPKRTRLDPHDD